MNGWEVLRQYARLQNPETLPPHVLHSYTESTLTLYHPHPKAKCHLIILPRIKGDTYSYSCRSLQILLSCNRRTAKDVLVNLGEAAVLARREIERKMIREHGFKWDLWFGFHAVSSMIHLHLHVISSDLCSKSLRQKRHYNSFSPKLGFFMHYDEVMSWFEEEPSFLYQISRVDLSAYSSMLGAKLQCYRCSQTFPNIHQMKDHLSLEWEKLAEKEKGRG